ncbi:3-oxo-5-alpha-steroid 4-dehydrogenase 2-like [Crassostrea virginica]
MFQSMYAVLEKIDGAFSAHGSLSLVSGVMMCWGLSNFVSLQFTTAPYGRYVRAGWGVPVSARLAWFLQELPSFLVPLLISLGRYNDFQNLHAHNNVLIGCFLLHYFHRTFIFPLRIRGGKPVPLVPFLVAVFFCTVNGAVQTYGVLLSNSEIRHGSQQIRLCSGIVTFLSGMYINIRSDILLTQLRGGSTGEYKIPRGFLFEYVSGANFLGEIVEWIGFYVACYNLPSLAFAVFTLCNIGPRAFHHHRFYRQKFKDYPSNRKALIPFIW